MGYGHGFADPVAAGATKAFAEEFTHCVSLDTNAVNVLQKLHDRYKLGIVSNFSIPECGRDLLERFGLREYFDVVVISGEINQRKPSPKIFRRALKSLGVAPSKTVFVGDTPDLDVKGPKSVGIKTVLIKRKPLRADVDVKPDSVIESLIELPALLETEIKSRAL